VIKEANCLTALYVTYNSPAKCTIPDKQMLCTGLSDEDVVPDKKAGCSTHNLISILAFLSEVVYYGMPLGQQS